MSATGQTLTSAVATGSEDEDASLSNRFFKLWPLGTCIPIIPSPRITLFDLICIAFFFLRPWQSFTNPMVTRSFRIAILLLNFCYLLSFAVNGGDPQQLVWRLGSLDIFVIESLALCSILARASLSQLNTFFFYYCFGVCLQIIYPENSEAYTQPIKFVLNAPLGVVLAMICYMLPSPLLLRRFLCGCALLLYSIVSVLDGARGAAAIAIIPVFIYFLPQLRMLRQFSLRTYLLSIAGVLAGGYGLLTLYYNIAISGILGRQAQGIAKLQGGFFGGGAGILLGGRPEVIVLSLGIIAKPLLGHGVGNDLTLYERMLVLADIWRPQYLDTPDKSIIHSLLFSTGFEAGIFSMFFWLYISHLCLRAIIQAIAWRPPAFEIALLLCVQALWTVFFSALVGVTRLALLPGIVYGFYALSQARNSKQA